MNFLDKADNVRSVKGSDRVLRCEDTGEEFPIGAVAKALAEKFSLDKRAATMKLNHAVRNNKPAFSLRWALASGTPYAQPVKRGPRKAKDGEATEPKKRKK